MAACFGQQRCDLEKLVTGLCGDFPRPSLDADEKPVLLNQSLLLKVRSEINSVVAIGLRRAFEIAVLNTCMEVFRCMSAPHLERQA
ncbi:hypothetical protein DB728_29430 [Rhizobium leguminosarum bv. viciae USDA 2370]|nr:hypothetical protein BS629_04760 [Rhizobium leguminosarum bv. viciae USDA 2370]PUB61073.1 hypothetical protein DB728_29430 [Rhizobium leguminosarum bv. viciae USDA 2370]